MIRAVLTSLLVLSLLGLAPAPLPSPASPSQPSQQISARWDACKVFPFLPPCRKGH